ncbi:MAG: hypothetical protein FWE23_10295 [Chitinivibrionia bacterium]|nr:hypothetical protein [Chitinivibrionia bacterium]
MSKLIAFCTIFLVIAGIFTAIFFISVPKSLKIMKAGIVEAGQKNGIIIEIRNSRAKFPNKIEFSDIQISDFSQNFNATIKSCRIDFYFGGYIRAVLRRITMGETIHLQNFSQIAILQGIDLKIAENQIFTKAQGNIFFETQKYEITANNFNDFGFEIKNFSACGELIDSALISINSNFQIPDNGEIDINGFLFFDSLLIFQNPEIEIRGIEIGNLFPDLNVSGTLAAEITPYADEFTLNAEFLQNIKNIEASASVSINNFRDSGNRFTKQILSALAFVGINSLDFANVSADIKYSPSKIVINDFMADNFRFAILADGRFYPKSSEYRFSAGIRFSPAMRSIIERGIWEAMTPDIPQNEGRFLGASVSGKGENISISFDDQTFRRGINTLLSSIRDIFR